MPITTSPVNRADVLDCGHRATPNPSGTGGTGRALNPATGTTLCYPCADAQQRQAMARANSVVAYVSTDGRMLTTWSGGHVATIDYTDTRQPGQRALTPSGGRCTRYVWHATDNDGGRWSGVNAGPGMVIGLRRLRVCTWHTGTGNGRGTRYCHHRATHAGPGDASDLYCRAHARQVLDLHGVTTTALPPRALAPVSA